MIRLNPIFSIILLLLYGTSALAQISSDVNTGQSAINEVYLAILNKYVAEIDPDKLSEAAINGMLQQLDPYSEYIRQGQFSRVDDITKGRYGGVGIHLGRLNDSAVVIAPMDGTPAFHQGILSGDRIIRVDSIFTRDMRLDEIADLLRGESGTPVTLLIKRPGEFTPLSFELTRELIRVPDISYSGLLRSKTGYVRLSNFTRYSGEELEKTVRKLLKANAQSLILDLRGNPGGLLHAALMSADLFIEKDKLLLETRGRADNSNNQYFSHRNPITRPGLPIAILVDGGSASAAEILSGILQDYDRAIIIGEPTFGKGLVQTISNLNSEDRLKLTTARYYLPSGRLIQKRDIASDLVYEENQHPELNDDFYSQNRRNFKSGRGVHPDLEINPLPLTDIERELWRKRLFFKFGLEYKSRHPDMELPVKFSESIVDSFYVWMHAENLFPRTALYRWIVRGAGVVDSTNSNYKSLEVMREQLLELEETSQREALRAVRLQVLSGLETEMSNILGGNGARVAASLTYDPVVQQTIDLLLSGSDVADILAGSHITQDN